MKYELKSTFADGSVIFTFTDIPWKAPIINFRIDERLFEVCGPNNRLFVTYLDDNKSEDKSMRRFIVVPKDGSYETDKALSFCAKIEKYYIFQLGSEELLKEKKEKEEAPTKERVKKDGKTSPV